MGTAIAIAAVLVVIATAVLVVIRSPQRDWHSETVDADR